jgi:hypothetical protein
MIAPSQPPCDVLFSLLYYDALIAALKLPTRAENAAMSIP